MIRSDFYDITSKTKYQKQVHPIRPAFCGSDVGLYHLHDGRRYFVARGVGEQALAAVNLCMPMINGAFSMGILFAVGASTRASICKGRGDTQESNRVFTIGAVTVAAIGLLTALTATCCSRSSHAFWVLTRKPCRMSKATWASSCSSCLFI